MRKNPTDLSNFSNDILCQVIERTTSLIEKVAAVEELLGRYPNINEGEMKIINRALATIKRDFLGNNVLYYGTFEDIAADNYGETPDEKEE